LKKSIMWTASSSRITSIDVEGLRSLGKGPVWLQPKGVDDFSALLDTSKRLGEAGFSGIGLLIPVTRGVNDVERWKYQLPANARVGIEIKTPAMALAAGSFIGHGISMVNLELKSLVQLSMGLAKPDREIHETVLDLIGEVIGHCRQIRAKCCVYMESECMTDENIESLIRRGVDMLCVGPSVIGDLKNVVARVEKKLLLESCAVKNGPEGPGSQPYQPEPATDSLEPAESDDFNPAFSFY
jgi:hypothetical protein